MPEMPAVARALVTSPPYRLIARRVVLPWVLKGEHPAGGGLEIGARGGAMAAQLLTAFPRLQMVVTDYDAAMVAAARHPLAPFGDRARAERANATRLPFADSRFDFVFSAAMLHHVGAWENALAEAVRVLRPGELCSATTCSTPPWHGCCIFGERHDTRLLRPAQLDAELAQLQARQHPHPAGHRQPGRQVRRQQSPPNAKRRPAAQPVNPAS
jgi:SAM-dependent methyltransferase